MTSSISDQVQATLGSAYTLERELGGGGMSRVFIARDESLGREVVVKVLASDLSEGVSAERFTREIRLAAALQEPHIVPVLTAGVTSAGLPFYTMPFVAGESLRARLDRAKRQNAPVPREEAVGILRDIMRALAYAHGHGIVHRDIKPENVLLSGRTAVVTDFGIAKALQAAKTEAPGGPASQSGALTRTGTSLGTPAYMAPEQAAGDPATDYRADLYAWGVVGYELLAGRHPFADRTTPQGMIAAHFSETPAPLPPDVPRGLAALVLASLAKDPAERPPSAEAVLSALDAARDEAIRESERSAALPTRGVVLRALALYAVVVAVVVLGTPRLMDALGLPDWVLPGTLALAALGLPLVLLALHVRQRTHAPFTARQVALTGASVVLAFALLVGGYMGLRVLGIGPAGSLLAAGTIAARDTVVVADFAVSGPDTALGSVVAEAVRTDLGQSRTIEVAPMGRVVRAVRRMERDPAQPLGEALAREVAQREGFKAVVAGDVTPLGSGYVVTLRLVAAATGDVLASFRETADSPDGLIPAVEGLTRALRGKIGESLASVRDDARLAYATTSSLPALRQFTAGGRAMFAGDYAKAVTHMREAVALDSTFADAHRLLAITLSNLGIDPVGQDSALARAYRYSDRLQEPERLVTTAEYWVGPGGDRRRAAAAYEALLALDSADGRAFNQYANIVLMLREFARAESLYHRSFELRPTHIQPMNLVRAQLAQGKIVAAESTLQAAQARWPEITVLRGIGAWVALERRMFDSAEVRAQRLLAAGADPMDRADATSLLASVATARGQAGLAERRLAEARALRRAAGDSIPVLEAALADARLDLWTRNAPAAAVARLDTAFRAHPVSSLSTATDLRLALEAAAVYAAAGDAAKARDVMRAVEAAADPSARRLLGPELALVRAELALRGGRAEEAIELFRASDVAADGGAATLCATCVLPNLARAAEQAGWSDSARVFWTAYIERPALNRSEADQWHLARAYRRLGELWSAAGDQARARRYHARFVALRENADETLQPDVAAVRQLLASQADTGSEER